MRLRGAAASLLLATALFVPMAAGIPAPLPLDPAAILEPVSGSDPGAPLPGPERSQDPRPDPGFAENVRKGFEDQMVLAGLATVTLAGIGLAGFALVSRYITPKEALKNPQRAMLYGFVRGNPGVHLKRLSEEFHMKTSSILWHIRKLESAELVRSERANGFRVFYPTAGGVEVRNVSRALTALQNDNAAALFAAVEKRPGSPSAKLADALGMHAGTARWHLKKLKEFGLVEEVPGPEGARYMPTPLGQKAFASLSSVGHAPAAPAVASA
jgi:DNA-binding MarR family transcriptional regulator